MHWIDLSIFVVYLLAMLGVGLYFMRHNKSKDDYYVGGRKLSAGHIGLSVVATDVGGGFSIGLGGLGFTMGLSGNWMLFTGLIGAWLSAAFLIPRVYPIAKKYGLLSFPQALQHFYTPRVAFVAGLISLIGYLGFTSSQILAGAKLAAATFQDLDVLQAVWVMGVIAVVYTMIGGIKAVIYTDTIQWIILMAGLIFIGIPMGYSAIGGWSGIEQNLRPELLELNNITWVQGLNWMVTIVPIWFVGMTLYQRIYACRDEKTARKAWRIAGLFEWPLMAFMGVILGLFARIALDQGIFVEMGYGAETDLDPELGLPLFLRTILPIGLMGLMMSAYFSAIMSTADSCLMAASGNFITDIYDFLRKRSSDNMKMAQWVTGIFGALAILLATSMQNVLELMLYSYAFMVSGLFVPVMGMLILRKPKAGAALLAMIFGGGSTLSLILLKVDLPFNLDANVFGIAISLAAFSLGQWIFPSAKSASLKSNSI